ncbi:MAG: hypothetical protein IJB34_03130 [Clostridia bacterium]|nr:hypothetical protein [Clostridia bacterium]
MRKEEFWEKFKKPKSWVLALVYICTLLFIALALTMLFIDYAGTWLEIVAYASFALAACSLAYSVYTLVRFAPTLKKKLVAFLENHRFTRTLVKDFGFRTVVFSILSFFASLAFGVFNGAIGIFYRSVWYGALAGYYILLTLLRGSILLYHNNRRRGVRENEAVREARTCRNGGILLLVLNAALSVAIAQMIFDDQAFVYAGWTIYAFAAYAFYKITMSIVNFFRAQKQDDLTVQAVRIVNLTDGMVSVLALQTALLSTFSDATLRVSDLNTATGIAVSAINLALGIFMIVRGAKRIKTEEQNHV